MTDKEPSEERIEKSTEPSSYSSRVSREELYNLVWAEPMLRVAQRFGVSSSYMARICSLLNVPRPCVGYWAKIKAGKTADKPVLPQTRVGDQLTWDKNGPALVHSDTSFLDHKDSASLEREVTVVKKGLHRLIRNSEDLYRSTLKPSGKDYLKPKKKLLADVLTSEKSLPRILSLANTLFLSLEKRGHRVVIASNHEPFRRLEVDEKTIPRKYPFYNNLWSPQRATVVYIGSIAIGLTVYEQAEELKVTYIDGEYYLDSEIDSKLQAKSKNSHSWNSTHILPTGKFSIKAYSPYWTTDWHKTWSEQQDGRWSSKIRGIIHELETAEAELTKQVAEGELKSKLHKMQWEFQCEQNKRERKKQEIEELINESKLDLVEAIRRWDELASIHRFFSEAVKSTQTLPEDERIRILRKIEEAKELIGDANAFQSILSWQTPKERIVKLKQERAWKYK